MVHHLPAMRPLPRVDTRVRSDCERPNGAVAAAAGPMMRVDLAVAVASLSLALEGRVPKRAVVMCCR